jgi:pimeloyl-ACP methyl ester carboxylesterase
MTRAHDAPSRTTFQGFGGLRLAADEWLRDGRAVLMLHGGGQNRHSWKRTGQVLADNGCHVIVLDGRGHGDSEWAPDGDYSIDAFTADARAVVDQVGKPVVVVGASLGGMTGILLARALGPEKVTGLLLVDVVPRVETAGTDRIRDFMSSGMEGFESLDEAAEAVAAYLPHRTKPRSSEGLTRNLRYRDGRWFWHWDPAFLVHPENSPIGRTDEIKSAAIELAMPVLLIRGKLSDVVSQQGVDEFLRDVPTAEFVELSNAGHTAAGDDNDAFSDAVLDFVNRVKS